MRPKPLATSATPTAVGGNVSSSDGSTACGESLERCAAPTMLQQSEEILFPSPRLHTRSAAVQTAALCCEAMVATEVAKVKAETEEAMRRLCEERDNAVQQVAELNTRLRDVEMICERLTEENVSGPCFF